jgi:hypothetical protein
LELKIENWPTMNGTFPLMMVQRFNVIERAQGLIRNLAAAGKLPNPLGNVL